MYNAEGSGLKLQWGAIKGTLKCLCCCTWTIVYYCAVSGTRLAFTEAEVVPPSKVSYLQ